MKNRVGCAVPPDRARALSPSTHFRPPVVALLLALLLCALAPAAMAQSLAGGDDDDDSVLVLGRVSDDPKAHYDQLKPLLDYVVPRMADVGIRSGRVLMARDLQQMASYMRRGRVDWITETSGNAVLLERRAGARTLLVAERDGAVRYRGVVIVRRDSPILRLQDLAGRSVAFQSP